MTIGDFGGNGGMKALVIGGTGIIGNHVIRALLKEGIDVRSLSRGLTSSQNLDDIKVESVRGDATDAASLITAMRGCDWVFHTAAYYPTHTFDRAGHSAQAKAAIAAFIYAVSKSSVKKVVYTSSLTTIGQASNLGRDLADESLPYDLQKNPPHPYFEVKYLMEEEIKKAAKQLPITIVNPTGCFGPYELKPKHLCIVPQLVNRKLPAYYDHPINVVDTVDVAYGHFLAAQKGAPGDRIILGGHNWTVSQLIESVCHVAKVKPPAIKVPLNVALVPSFLSECWGRVVHEPPAFPILGLRFVQYGQNFDLSKQKNVLGLKTSPMEPCFEKAIHWFKKIGYC